MNLFLFALGVYLLGGLIQSFLNDRLKGPFFAISSTLATVMFLLPAFHVLLSGHPLINKLVFPFPLGEIGCELDSLSAFFIIIIGLVSLAGVFYSTGYLKPYLNHKRPTGSHFFCMALLITFMLLVTILRNALAFLIAWEIMSLSSFFLVTFENEKKEVFAAGIHYLIAMHIGVVFLISAFLILSIESGSLSFNSFANIMRNQPHLASLVFIFFFVGFGTKAGFFPFHVWLPKAHPAAPGHISALMSAVMIKTGIYGILRILTLMGIPARSLGYMILGISLVSALTGIFYALAQRDTKRLLAYSSIENIGLIGMGIGIGMLGLSYHDIPMVLLGFSASLVHLFNHSIFKSLLFFSAGAIYQHTHERDMEKMGGLTQQLPYTSTFSLTGSAAISGLPPLNGFFGKFLLFLALIKGIQVESPLLNAVCILVTAGLAFISASSLMAFSRLFGIVFLGVPRQSSDLQKNTTGGSAIPQKKKDVSLVMLIPMGILSVICLVTGLFPHIVLTLVEKPLQLLGNGLKNNSFWTMLHVDTISQMAWGFFIFIALSVGLFLVRNALLKNRQVSSAPTWGCGYTAPNNRMQYTASSFSRTLLLLFKKMTGMKLTIEQPTGIFAKKSKLETRFPDFLETNLVNPILQGIDKGIKLLGWVQGGATQQYILYGLLFLVGAILWVLWG